MTMEQVVVAVGIGVVGVAVSLVLYWRSQIPAVIAVQSLDASLIGGDDPALPPEVEVFYQKRPVQTLTSSTVWIWNSGRKPVRRQDIVAKNPLRLVFSGDVLECKPTRESRPDIEFRTVKKATDVLCDFEFLEPGDGGVVEVLHTGSADAPVVKGTIIGLGKRGPQYRGRAWGAYIASKQPETVRGGLHAAVFAIGVGITVVGILGDRVVPTVFLPASGTWSLIPLGLVYAGLPAYLFWSRRRRFPSVLALDATEGRPANVLSIIDRP